MQRHVLDRQPSLDAALLSVRPLAAEDWDALYTVASDPMIWEGHPVDDRWREPVFRRFFRDALDSGGALVVTDNATGQMIGASRYDHRRARPREVEVGWTFLSRSHWGGQHNRALKRLMVGHALATVEQVIFLVGETNIRSQTSLSRLGARLTRRRVPVEMDGGITAHRVYAIDRTAYAQGPLGRADEAADMSTQRSAAREGCS